MTNRGLTAAELRRAASLARDTQHDPRGDFVPHALLEALVDLVPSFDLAYTECDLAADQNVGFQDVNDIAETNAMAPLDDSDGHIWRILRTERSRVYLYSGRARADVVRTFDFYTEREWRSSDVYAESYRVVDEWNHMIVPLPPRDGVRRNVIFMRSIDEGGSPIETATCCSCCGHTSRHSPTLGSGNAPRRGSPTATVKSCSLWPMACPRRRSPRSWR